MPSKKRPRTLNPNAEALEARVLLSLPGTEVPSLLVGLSSSIPSRPLVVAVRVLKGSFARVYEQGPVKLTFPPGTNLSAAAARLQATPGIRYAELPGTLTVDAIPNDPSFGSLWGLNTRNDVDIDAPEAWNLATGSASVIVAVVDSGLDLSHPDLAGQVWTNSREIPGNGIDDDRNGYRDDVRGWNFITNTNNVRDDTGHGTHVSGTIAARMNNSAGVVGVAPGARIMTLKFIGSRDQGSVEDAVEAIYYAVNNGARVINASWGTDTYSQALADAIRFAGSRNVVVVAAAGNDGRDNAHYSNYPANLDLANLLSVAAVDSAGQLATFSNYGSTTVDVAAPGVSILSLAPRGRYVRLSGTSMAVPHVAGTVALLISANPSLTAAQLTARIRDTAKPLPGLTGKLISPGIVSAYRALSYKTPAATPAAATVAQGLRFDELREVIVSSEEYYIVNGGTPEGFVAGLYRDLLGRDAWLDPGAWGWVNVIRGGKPRNEDARVFLGTSEAQRTLIARWLQDYLGRTTPLEVLKIEPSVIAWADEIVRGRQKSDVLLTLLSSDAYRAAAGGTATGLVSKLYSDLLNRPASRDPGSTGWVSVLEAGTPTYDVARVVVFTREARQTLIARWFRDDLGRNTPLDQLKFIPEIVDWAGRLIY